MLDLRRREFITLLGGAAAAWPLRVFAQERTPVIGFLSTASPGPSAHLVRAFNQGLAEAGYTDGRNVSIEYRWADGQHDRLSALVADLVRQQVSVIAATGGSPSALAAKHATSTIPIVFQVGVDPVAVGLVTSLSQPGANITGATMLAVELGQKRLELLREIVPTATRIAALINPTSPGAAILSRDLRSAAAKLGLQVHVLNASSDRDLDSAFQAVAETRSGALLIGADPLFNSRSKRAV